jgi:hypothetical protein
LGNLKFFTHLLLKWRIQSARMDPLKKILSIFLSFNISTINQFFSISFKFKYYSIFIIQWSKYPHIHFSHLTNFLAHSTILSKYSCLQLKADTSKISYYYNILYLSSLSYFSKIIHSCNRYLNKGNINANVTSRVVEVNDFFFTGLIKQTTPTHEPY